jgi:ribose/xylose/arabinose/galactoside ABC-type transport system permease subunit
VALLGAAMATLTGGNPVSVTGGPDLLRWQYPTFFGAVLISVAGGAVALVPRARASLGSYRATGDPADARPPGGNAVAVGALVLSSALATGAGLVTVFRLHQALPVDTSLTAGTLPAVAAALLGGVSVHGRRGGVFGTALAVITVQSVLLWLGLGNAEPWVSPAVLGGAILLGLIVSRTVETLGRPREPEPSFADMAPQPQQWPPADGEPGGYEPGYQPRYDTGYQPAENERY